MHFPLAFEVAGLSLLSSWLLDLGKRGVWIGWTRRDKREFLNTCKESQVSSTKLLSFARECSIHGISRPITPYTYAITFYFVVAFCLSPEVCTQVCIYISIILQMEPMNIRSIYRNLRLPRQSGATRMLTHYSWDKRHSLLTFALTRIWKRPKENVVVEVVIPRGNIDW
jgi:hypothetical protein